MESVHKLERTVADWYKNVPHLPKNGQKWLADNVWWIVIIGIALSALGLFGIISLLFLAGAGLTMAGGLLGSGYGAAAGAAIGGFLIITSLISLAVYIVELILMVMAVMPLKAHKKRGWNLLFLITLINVASIVVTGLLTMNLFSIFWGVLWVAVGVYFLYEIRSHFEGHKLTAKKPEAKKA